HSQIAAHVPVFPGSARCVSHDDLRCGGGAICRGDALPRLPLPGAGSMAADFVYDATPDSPGLRMDSDAGGMGLPRTPASAVWGCGACDAGRPYRGRAAGPSRLATRPTGRTRP